MEDHAKPAKLNFSLLIFFVCLLFTFLVWDRYVNSNEPLDRALVSHVVLIMGVLFSTASALFAWSLESRSEFFEREYRRRSVQLSLQINENKKAERTASAIYEAAHLMYSRLDLNGLCLLVMDLVKKVMGADEGSLLFLGPDNVLTLAASWGIPEETAKTIRVPLGERVVGRAAKLRRDYLIIEGLENYPEFSGIPSNPRIRSSIVCPLIYQNEVYGVLTLNRTVTLQNFSVDDLMNASVFTSLVALAVRNARLFKEVEERDQQLDATYERLAEIRDLINRLS